MRRSKDLHMLDLDAKRSDAWRLGCLVELSILVDGEKGTKMAPDIITSTARVPASDPVQVIGWPQDRGPLPRTFAFGPFMLQPERQLLLRDGRPVRIGGRAFDILATLVDRPGQLVSKRELVERVWPAIFVDESNLKTNMAMLRRVLGERHLQPVYIATIIGRGYRFVSPVQTFGDGYDS